MNVPHFYCENCGEEVAARAKLCPNCGRFFSEVRCPRCSHTGEARDFMQGCPQCGYLRPRPKGQGAPAEVGRYPGSGFVTVDPSVFAGRRALSARISAGVILWAAAFLAAVLALIVYLLLARF